MQRSRRLKGPATTGCPMDTESLLRDVSFGSIFELVNTENQSSYHPLLLNLAEHHAVACRTHSCKQYLETYYCVSRNISKRLAVFHDDPCSRSITCNSIPWAFHSD